MALARLRTTTPDILKIDQHVQLWLKDGLYSQVFLAMIIGNGCDSPYLVHVPVDIDIPEYHSIDDLNVRMYMWMTDEPEFKTFHRNREHVNRFPTNAHTALENPFTFFFEEDTAPTSNNRLIRKLGTAYESASVETLRGNVVVLKHKTDGSIDNMRKSDWPLVKVILECFSLGTPAAAQTPSVELLHMILANRDVRYTLFEHTSVLSLFSSGATCTTMHDWVQTFYRSRVKRLLGNVFPAKLHPDFFNVLHSHKSRIGGSMAYAIVDPSTIFIPNNINILSPWGEADSFRDVLLRDWECTLEQDEPTREPVNSDMFPPRTMHLKTAQGYSITITESDNLSLTALMLNGYTTAECVLVGGHTFTLLYPSLVDNGEVLRLPSIDRAIPEEVLDCVGARFKLLESTEDLGRPCRESCPNLWRRSIGMKDVATLYWGGFRGGKDSRLIAGSFEWKLAHTCRNPLCKWSKVSPMQMCKWLWWNVAKA
ncbi:hypothetical protein EV361DRAFT_1011288 [Lentinula raphanica]|nr:hypothetical protein EV361DRAFT_1011288 [Lentinula raphanica]